MEVCGVEQCLAKWYTPRLSVFPARFSAGSMTFTLVDRITEFVPESHIVVIKCLSLGEEYLRDHFPKFPVMPGVLMLETLYQAASWLVGGSEGFTHSLVLLQEAKNVRYSGFVTPGHTLTAHVEWVRRQGTERQGTERQDEEELQFRGQGTVDGAVVVSAKLSLSRRNLADHDPRLASLDRDICELKKIEFEVLRSANRQLKPANH